MKLHEIKGKPRSGGAEKKVTIEPAGGEYGEVDVLVKYTVSAGGSSRHGDNSSFDEDHPDEYEIDSITLRHEVEQYDKDGQEVVKTWPKGSDATKLPGWKSKDDDAVQEKL